MKNSWKLFVLLSGLLLVFAVPASAQTTNKNISIITPVANALITAATGVNATAWVNGTSFACSVAGCQEAAANITNVSFFLQGVGQPEVLICQNTSNALNGSSSNWTCSWDPNLRLDNFSKYSHIVKIYNSSGANLVEQNKTNVGGIDIDIQNPTLSVTTVDKTVVGLNDVVRATIINASIMGTNITVQFGSNARQTLTCSNNICSFTIPVTLADAAYPLTFRASDGIDEVTASISVVVQKKTGKGGLAALAAAQQQQAIIEQQAAAESQSQGWFFLILLVAAAMLFKKKKGG